MGAGQRTGHPPGPPVTALRTVHVIDSLGPGGAEHSLVELLTALAGALDPAVAVLARRPDDAPLAQRLGTAGVPVHAVSRTGLRGLVRRLRPDLVHTTLVTADIVGRLASWGTGVPVVTSLVNTTYDPVRRADPAVSAAKLAAVRALDGLTARRLTAGFHAITRAVADAAVRDLGVDPERIVVVPRGRDTTRLGTPSAARRERARAALGIDHDAPVVVTVGRQEFQKGHEVLVEAAALVAERHPGLVVVHAGRTGTASPALRRTVERSRVDVRLLGHRQDVAEVLCAGDVFAFPSRFEGLGGAVLEAMAMGLPVVASDVPALREVLAAAGQVLVPPGQPGPLAAALTRLLDDGALRSETGTRARAAFLGGYTLDVVAPRMQAFFADAARMAASWR